MRLPKIIRFLILSAIAAMFGWLTNDLSAESTADTVFACDFEEGSDPNYDGWPDGWTRKRGPSYPQYLRMKIDEDCSALDRGAVFRFFLDGGAAKAVSPKRAIEPRFSYRLEALVKGFGLKHDHVSISIAFLDSDLQILETYSSPPLVEMGKWTLLQTASVAPTDPSARWAVVTLDVEPGEKEDLTGEVMFDDVHFVRLPRMSLTAVENQRILQTGQSINVVCEVSGNLDDDDRIQFSLIDHNGVVFEQSEQKLVRETPAKEAAGSQESNTTVESGGATGKAKAKFRLDTPGYYRVVATMGLSRMSLSPREISFAVVPPSRRPETGVFGWSLANGAGPIPAQELPQFLLEAGVHSLKYPVWFPTQTPSVGERIAWLAERLSLAEIEMVGVLDQPSKQDYERFQQVSGAPIALLLDEPAVWGPTVDPVFTRLSLKVHRWQLGRDDDHSFVSYPNLQGKISQIRNYLSRYGHTAKLGLNWSTDHASPTRDARWSFLSYGEDARDATLTASELEELGRDATSQANESFFVLRPLPQSVYPTDVRVRDLIERMIAVRRLGYDRCFVSNPFDTETGIMRPEGTPGELFIPWRLAAEFLGGSEYQGSIQLQGGSPNHVFVRGNDCVIVAWNERPTIEHAYLGEDAEQMDPFGRTTTIKPEEKDGSRQHSLPLGPTPTFFIGVESYVAQWLLSCDFVDGQVKSLFGRQQDVTVKFKNPFPQPVGGQVTLHAPTLWDAPPRPIRFRMGSGEEKIERIPIQLSPVASTGPQKVRLDFEITAGRVYRFSVHRTIYVGLPDVSVEVETRVNRLGELVVEQHVTNTSDRLVSFQCILFAPGRRRQRKQIINLGRDRTTVTFILPNAEELLGQDLWTRAEEIGGARILNHHIKASK